MELKILSNKLIDEELIMRRSILFSFLQSEPCQ